MGRLSEIYSSYKRSLDRAQDEYEESVRAGASNAREFYYGFFRDLTVNLGERLGDRDFVGMIADEVEAFFGKRELDFIAVDGSCHKRSSGEFISFYGGAYGAKGVLSLSGGGATVEYKRWEIEKDVSMVAFVPIPYSRMLEVNDSHAANAFAVSESDRIELTSMHLPMMQLAEVFLAYNSATSSSLDSPDIVLIDNSLSGMLGYTDFGPDKVRLAGCTMPDGTVFGRRDVIVAQAHPFSQELGIPSTKKFTERSAVLRFLHESGPGAVSTDDIASGTGMGRGRLGRVIGRLAEDGMVEIGASAGTITKKIDPYRSWEKTKSMFPGNLQGDIPRQEGERAKVRGGRRGQEGDEMDVSGRREVPHRRGAAGADRGVLV